MFVEYQYSNTRLDTRAVKGWIDTALALDCPYWFGGRRVGWRERSGGRSDACRTESTARARAGRAAPGPGVRTARSQKIGRRRRRRRQARCGGWRTVASAPLDYCPSTSEHRRQSWYLTKAPPVYTHDRNPPPQSKAPRSKPRYFCLFAS